MHPAEPQASLSVVQSLSTTPTYPGSPASIGDAALGDDHRYLYEDQINAQTAELEMGRTRPTTSLREKSAAETLAAVELAALCTSAPALTTREADSADDTDELHSSYGEPACAPSNECPASNLQLRPCAACKTSRVRCDRGLPCSRCKKIGALCRPPPTVKRGRPAKRRACNGSSFSDLAAKVTMPSHMPFQQPSNSEMCFAPQVMMGASFVGAPMIAQDNMIHGMSSAGSTMGGLVGPMPSASMVTSGHRVDMGAPTQPGMLFMPTQHAPTMHSSGQHYHSHAQMALNPMQVGGNMMASMNSCGYALHDHLVSASQPSLFGSTGLLLPQTSGSHTEASSGGPAQDQGATVLRAQLMALGVQPCV